MIWCVCVCVCECARVSLKNESLFLSFEGYLELFAVFLQLKTVMYLFLEFSRNS